MKTENVIKKFALSASLIASLGAMVGLSGCATTSLIEQKSSHPYTTTTSKTVQLVDDNVVAFGTPASPLPNAPTNSVVIVGEKNSYVLMQGGQQVAQILSYLDPRYIQLTRELSFHSAKNDGTFTGSLDLSYAKLKDEYTRNDINFMLSHGGQECSTASDLRINAQRFCFKTPLQGGIYPAVSNLNLIQSKFKPLSHPYHVTINTQVNEQSTSYRGGTNPLAKLVLLPFALAFDVVTLPVQILSQ